jgi:hypothetical protein
MRDLFVDAATPSMTKPEIVETYPYTAEDGTLLYESVRYVPKAFLYVVKSIRTIESVS